MMQHNNIEQALFPCEHLYKNWLRSCCLVFTPPIPRFVFGSCCRDLSHGSNITMGGHSEKMLGEHCSIRNSLKGILAKEGLPNTRVLDTLGAITGKNSVASQLEVLKSITAKDNVHLTPSGYRSLAEGVLREAANFDMPKRKGRTLLLASNRSTQLNGTALCATMGLARSRGRYPRNLSGDAPILI